MEERAPHLTAALAGAARHSHAAFELLCAAGDPCSVEMIARCVSESETYLKLAAVHPSPHVRAVWWAQRISTASRGRRALAAAAGQALPTHGVERLLCLMGAQELSAGLGDVALSAHLEIGERSAAELAALHASAQGRFGPETQLRLVEAVGAAPEVSASVAEQVLSELRWSELVVALLGSAATPSAWLGPWSSDEERVLLARRMCTDALVEGLLARASVSFEWSAHEAGIAELEVALAGGPAPQCATACEAVRQSVCAQLGRASAEALREVLQQLQVEASVWEIVGSAASASAVSRALEHVRGWKPRVGAYEQARELCDAYATRAQAAVHELVAQVRAGSAEAAAEMAKVMTMGRNDPLREELSQAAQERAARLLVDVEVAWEHVSTLVEVADPSELDAVTDQLPRTLAGDERFVQLATNVPYICDIPDLRMRRQPATVARRVIVKLCDASFTPAGYEATGGYLHWRATAISHACEVARLRPSEVGVLPWALDHNEETSQVVGRYLAKRLGEQESAWEILAGIAPSFEGSVEELAAATLACCS